MNAKEAAQIADRVENGEVIAMGLIREAVVVLSKAYREREQSPEPLDTKQYPAQNWL